MFLEICMQIHFVVFALSRQISLTSKKYAKAVNLLCAGNKVFVTYQIQGKDFNPNLPRVRPSRQINLSIYIRTIACGPCCFHIMGPFQLVYTTLY